MKKKVWLHYGSQTIRGPRMVSDNLVEGLRRLPESVELVDKPGGADLVGCLQHPGGGLRDKLPPNTLMGPNLFVVPTEDPGLCGRYNNFVVPSDWVKNLYMRYSEMKNKNIHVWSVGINAFQWTPVETPPDLDCFLYFKNRSEEELRAVELLLQKKELSYEVLKYGSYQEEQLKSLCDRSKFAVLLTNTESQGIAYMNILSTNTPCYVFEQGSWTYQNAANVSAPASAVPYFDNRCGMIVIDRPSLGLSEATFRAFVDGVERNQYSPRQYILENHTLEIGAAKYLELLERANEKS